LLLSSTAGSDPGIRESWANSVHTGELTVRMGRWCWSPEAPGPTWPQLAKARYWASDKADRFKESFCCPKHVVRTIQSNESTQVAFNLSKADSKEKVAVTTFLGREESISEAVEQIQVRVVLYHVVQAKNFKIPLHVMALAEGGTPLLLWGKATVVEKVLTVLRKAHPLKVYLPMALYQRPETAQFNSRYRTIEWSSCLVADESSIQGQVPYLSFLLLVESSSIFRDARLQKIEDARLLIHFQLLLYH
jgi:hypothetical protein